MDDLIKALQIFRKYGNPENPVNCEYDELNICGINPNLVSPIDIQELEQLGFDVDETGECFYSFRFGSA